MTSTQSQQDQLTDPEYIRWTEKQEWSLTQSVYLLKGFNPPESNKTEEQLQRLFPDAENLLQNHKEWAKRGKKLEKLNRQSFDDESQMQRMRRLKEEYPCNPGSWVNRAFSNGMNFKDSWKAIFPNWMPDQHGYVTEEEANYNRFIQVFTRDTPTRLRELVGFALNLNEYQKDNPTAEYNRLLEDVNGELQPKAKDIDDLPSRLVSPQLFIEICSRLDIALDSQCSHWVEWKMRHPELEGYLEGSGKAKKRTKNSNKSLHEIGGEARADKLEELKQYAIKVYKSKPWSSMSQASRKHIDTVNTYAKSNGLIPVKKSTLLRWISEYKKETK